jgi:8-oxo-dGTP diphosphatase
MRYPLNMRVRASGLVLHKGEVLLIEYYEEEPGLHYVLPGGAVQVGEGIQDAVRREVIQEACMDVAVGPLILAFEYEPHKDPIPHNLPPALNLIFACRPLRGDARLPDCPDVGQTGVRWVAVDELDNIPLQPPIYKQILDYVYNAWRGIELLEEVKG